MTRADRINALVKKFAPDYNQEATGRSSHTVDNLPDGRARIRITNSDGDSTAGVGEDLDKAIDALEAKLS